VCAKKRESIVVLLDLLDLHIPAPHVVALVAAGSELSLVNIGVTVGALPSDIREDRLGVALGARYALVQSTQGEARGLVVELRNRPNGLPSFKRVAVLAGNTQWPMRAASCRLGLRLSIRCLLRQNAIR
jgi:hypothetical protein